MKNLTNGNYDDNGGEKWGKIPIGDTQHQNTVTAPNVNWCTAWNLASDKSFFATENGWYRYIRGTNYRLPVQHTTDNKNIHGFISRNVSVQFSSFYSLSRYTTLHIFMLYTKYKYDPTNVDATPCHTTSYR